MATEASERARLERQDKESAAAFVRGSSTKEFPERQLTAADFNRMSDTKFKQWQRENGIPS